MHIQDRKKEYRLLCGLLFACLSILSGCSANQPAAATPTLAPTNTAMPSATAFITATATPSATPSHTPTITQTPSPTATQTASLTPTITLTPTRTLRPTSTLTPTRTITPTPDYPDVTVKMQANCRYGPGTAYLYRWGLYPNDTADVRGRNWDGSWLWIHPSNLKAGANCWASKIVFNEKVDNAQVPYVQIPLPHTTFAGPPGNVQAVRNGSQVTVSWSEVPLSDDKRRGYMIEAQTCQNGLLLPIIIQTNDTSYTFNDEQHCEKKSGGLLYTAEKHGYSDPVKIPWP